MYKIEFEISKNWVDRKPSKFTQEVSKSVFKFLTSNIDSISGDDTDPNLVDEEIINKTESFLESYLGLQHEVIMNILEKTLGIESNEVRDIEYIDESQGLFKVWVVLKGVNYV